MLGHFKHSPHFTRARRWNELLHLFHEVNEYRSKLIFSDCFYSMPYLPIFLKQFLNPKRKQVKLKSFSTFTFLIFCKFVFFN